MATILEGQTIRKHGDPLAQVQQVRIEDGILTPNAILAMYYNSINLPNYRTPEGSSSLEVLLDGHSPWENMFVVDDTPKGKVTISDWLETSDGSVLTPVWYVMHLMRVVKMDYVRPVERMLRGVQMRLSGATSYTIRDVSMQWDVWNPFSEGVLQTRRYLNIHRDDEVPVYVVTAAGTDGTVVSQMVYDAKKRIKAPARI